MKNRNWRTKLKLFLTETGEEIPIPSGADVGIRQSLSVLPQAGSGRRSVNGVRISLKNPLFQKFITDISANDNLPVALAGLWPEELVTVHSVHVLPQRPSTATQTTLIRPPVSGSVYAVDDDGNLMDISIAGAVVTHPAITKIIFFSPILECALISPSSDRDDDAASVSWNLTFEEV
mgnify:CR=1 FL=1|tara:strand:- start:18663 stop:19193 length:531 start_codon:yes stop_codon:yes gene_type:complete